MKKCEKCKTQFSFKIIFLSFWKGYKNFVCTNCQAQYKFDTKDRLIGGLIIGLSTFIYGLTMSILTYYELAFSVKFILGMVSFLISSIFLSALSTLFFSFELD